MVLKIMNIVGFIGVIAVNIAANAIPINGKSTEYLSDQLPNLFVPAGFTFAIWGLIYLFLAAFCVFQGQGILSDKTVKMPFLNRIGYLFFITCVLNIAWIFAWHYQQIGLSLLLMLGLLFGLILIYIRLKSEKEVPGEGLYVRLSFSIYLGWISVATIANVTAYLVSIGWDGFGLSEVFWAILMVAVAAVLAIIVILNKQDIPFSFVVIWALFGIAIERLNSEPVEMGIVVVAFVGIALIAFGIIYHFFQGSREVSAM